MDYTEYLKIHDLFIKNNISYWVTGCNLLGCYKTTEGFMYYEKRC